MTDQRNVFTLRAHAGWRQSVNKATMKECRPRTRCMRHAVVLDHRSDPRHNVVVVVVVRLAIVVIIVAAICTNSMRNTAFRLNPSPLRVHIKSPPHTLGTRQSTLICKARRTNVRSFFPGSLRHKSPPQDATEGAIYGGLRGR